MSQAPLIYQFRIDLLDVVPQIWRRIQVPANYSFWELHVAIQDAMGWHDCHLHEFHVEKAGKKVRIGIPRDEPGDDLLTGWKTPIADYFKAMGRVALYTYDMGDGWQHGIDFEKIIFKEARGRYPRCLEGERACPPEDCGGVPGYENLLQALATPDSEECEELTAWLKDMGKGFDPYRPEFFDPKKVKFSNPMLRLAKLCGWR